MLKSAYFLFQIFKTLRLTCAESIIFLPPAVINLIGHSNLTDGLGYDFSSDVWISNSRRLWMIYSRLYLFFTIRPQLAMYLKNTNLTYGPIFRGQFKCVIRHNMKLREKHCCITSPSGRKKLTWKCSVSWRSHFQATIVF